MDQEAFGQLLQKYLRGECNEQEVQRIHQWYAGLDAVGREAVPDWNKEQLRATMWQRIEAETREPVTERTASRWGRSRILYAGLAAAVLLALGWVLYAGKVARENNAQEAPVVFNVGTPLLEFKNETDRTSRFTLPDGSVISLASGSRITYPKVFSPAGREVHLTGNAFFEITKNPQQPFYVYAGDIVTQVLGTSFRVKTHPGNNTIAVEVATGKVSVYEKRKPVRKAMPGGTPEPANGVVLTPNQQVIYYPEGRHWVTGLVQQPVPIRPAAGSVKLVFNDAPLGEVLAGLEQKFGIEIVSASEKLTNCTFTGDIADMPLFEKLDLVCKSIGASYEVKGTRILIAGQGCE